MMLGKRLQSKDISITIKLSYNTLQVPIVSSEPPAEQGQSATLDRSDTQVTNDIIPPPDEFADDEDTSPPTSPALPKARPTTVADASGRIVPRSDAD
ncbi:hypothetical protein AVEN_228704-1 [Araneus ventricosus]|uniref:Uncharacterized protein n=1 Tax=Araneus ventricosus TaxID=182803 RepID=A0A4Y2QHU2_ARAVE|nr:hypothetical protein AVEN_228704-1 [Araneus ventricosus]